MNRSPGNPAQTPPSHLFAWLELARLSNAPTVATNALVGATIASRWSALTMSGRAANDATSTIPHSIASATPAAWEILALAIAMVAMYAAGMILNDWFDLDIDRRERPSRPLPSGRISPSTALNVAIALLGAGAILACAVNGAALPWVLLLAASIVAYNIFHARALPALLLMTACRMLAVVVPAMALSTPGEGPWRLLGWYALPLGAYIAIVTLIARREVGAHSARPPRRRWAGLLLALPALIPVGALATGLLPTLTEERLFGASFLLGAMLSWIFRAQLFATPLPQSFLARVLPRRVRPGGVRMPRAIMAWLAAISLIDATSLVLLGEPGLSLVALGCFFIAAVAHSRIAGS